MSVDDRANDNGADNEGQFLLDPVPEEESDAASNPRKEIQKHCKWESNERDALEIKRCSERFWNRFAPFARYSNNARKLEVVVFLGRR